MLTPLFRVAANQRAHKIAFNLQLVEADKRCELTGVKLADIWRYFRFTWSLPYNTSPGRNLYFLIRDAGQASFRQGAAEQGFKSAKAVQASSSTLESQRNKRSRFAWQSRQ